MSHTRIAISALCLAFLVACGSDSTGNGAGSLHVRVNPPSSPLDPDGFDAKIDNGNSRPIPVDGELELEGMLPGEHTVQLTDVDTPCEVTTENPVTVTVVAGDVVTASFTVVCEHTGFIQARTQTTGTNIDPNGYFVDIDGGNALGIDPNGVTTLGVDAGDHTVNLSDVAANCTVQGDGPSQSVTVTGGQTAHVTFEVVCT